jgi:hypothetical protein
VDSWGLGSWALDDERSPITPITVQFGRLVSVSPFFDGILHGVLSNKWMPSLILPFPNPRFCGKIKLDRIWSFIFVCAAQLNKTI